MTESRFVRPLVALVAGAAALAALTACAPLVVGGAMVGGTMVAIDRRTSGAQIEDQAIELKAASRVGELATLGNVAVTSYNRMILITGEVPSEQERVRVEDALVRLENVRSVVNELAVGPNATFGTKSNDSYLSGKVKASLLDAKDLQSNAFKVVSERSIVYLLGRVTEREATRAADVARSVPGVKKVVRVFEVISEEELAGIQAKPKQ